MANTFCKACPNLQLFCNNIFSLLQIIKLYNVACLSLWKSCNQRKHSEIKWQLFLHDFQRISNNIFYDFNNRKKNYSKMRELNNYIPEVNQWERNWNLIRSNEICQLSIGDPFHYSFYQLRTTVCTPAHWRTIHLFENFLHSFQKENYRLLSCLFQPSPQFLLGNYCMIHGSIHCAEHLEQGNKIICFFSTLLPEVSSEETFLCTFAACIEHYR